MTGDYTPDMTALLSADIIISTPEKWDGISRNWHSRGYVKKVISIFSWLFFLSIETLRKFANYVMNLNLYAYSFNLN